MLEAVRRARAVIPDYGRGHPITTADVRTLAAAVQLDVERAVLPMDSPAMLLPPMFGHWQLVLAPDLNPSAVRHITLHEVGHVLMGDVDEPTFMTWRGPLPPNEDWVDLFALVAQLEPEEIEADGSILVERILELVPLDARGWASSRVPRLARKIGGLKNLLTENAEDA